jgi:hypothetical protein
MTGVHWSQMETAWLRSIVPELGGVPLYLRSASEIPAGHSLRNAAAWTGWNIDLVLKPHLQASGEWHGRGAAIIVSQSWDSFPETLQRGVLLHEVSHVLSNWGSWNDDPSELSLVEELSLIPGGIEFLDESHLAVHGAERYDKAATIRRQHGLAFVRAGLHLWARCCWEIPLRNLLLFADSYSLGDDRTSSAIKALRQEIDAGGNIVEILATNPPAEFHALFDETQAKNIGVLYSD